MADSEISDAMAASLRRNGIDPNAVVVLKRTPNPWGVVTGTREGHLLPEYVKRYMDRVEAEAARRTGTSRKHHYVPASYLKQWADPGGALRMINTTTGETEVKTPATACRIPRFYRVIGPDGMRHDQIENVLAIFDNEMAKTRVLFDELQPGDDVTFDEFVTLGLMVSLQHLRTPKFRRLSAARADWITQQDAQEIDPRLGVDYVRGFVPTTEMHVAIMFEQMWPMTDEMIRRQIYVYTDPQAQLPTCDAPVLAPLDAYDGTARNAGFIDYPRIWWPISPRRALCFDFDTVGEKVVFRKITGTERAEIERAVVRGRESYILPAPGSHNMPTRVLPQRTQFSVTCDGHRADRSCEAMFGYAYARAPQDTSCNVHKRLLWPDLHS